MLYNISSSYRLQALADLFKNYKEALHHAWQNREQNLIRKLNHELQFLPAVLSLQETPASPTSRLAMWMIISFAVLALLWASFGHIDVVATAQGKIIPSDRTKTIQPFETATVKAIHVTDGQQVKAGDVLIDLDATAAKADQDRILSDLRVAQLQVARAQAMLYALDNRRLAKLTRPNGIEDTKFIEAQRLLAGQMAEFSAKQNLIEAETVQREAALRSTQELVHKLELTTPIARQRAQDFKNLVDQNFVSKHSYLEREQIRIEQEADLANQRSRVREIEASLRETRSQYVRLIAETRRLNLDSITDGQQKVATLEQELLKANSHSKLMQLMSPVDGTVQQLVTHTVGGVVTPAQPVMVIVPHDHAVEIVAFIENKDIGFIKPNQEAEVKIETFQFTKYGTLHARVESVSHDAISDEKRGLIYSTRVKLEKSSINVDGTLVSLSPGMAVSVEIKTGKRRVIEYFLSPLLQHVNESLHER